MEDFAEIHSLVLENLQETGLQRRLPQLGEKIREIMRLYQLSAALTSSPTRS
jgi:hypothetical protein